MSKNPAEKENVQPLWRRIGKGIIGAGLTAAYVTGIALAAPVTLGITAGLGVLRGLATRDKEKQGLLSAIRKGAVQGMLAPFAASATLAIDAVKGRKTDFNDLILDSGTKMPNIPGFGKNSPEGKQPLWKRIGKVVAGAAMLGGTIAACVVAGPAVAVFAGVAAATGAYKGYKETPEGKSGVWGAIKGAINRVLSPVTGSALLIAHGLQGCETKSLAVNVFDGVGDQFAPNTPAQRAFAPKPTQPEEAIETPQPRANQAVAQQEKPALPPKPEHLRGNKLKPGHAIRSNLGKPAILPTTANPERSSQNRSSQGKQRRGSTGGISGGI